jgi:hypothetical protein
MVTMPEVTLTDQLLLLMTVTVPEMVMGPVACTWRPPEEVTTAMPELVPVILTSGVDDWAVMVVPEVRTWRGPEVRTG